MTPALKAMVEAIVGELERQNAASPYKDAFGKIAIDDLDLEKVARAGLEANGGVVDALRFYADQTNWASPSTGFVAQYDPEPSPFAKDRGARARAILDAILKDQP